MQTLFERYGGAATKHVKTEFDTCILVCGDGAGASGAGKMVPQGLGWFLAVCSACGGRVCYALAACLDFSKSCSFGKEFFEYA